MTSPSTPARGLLKVLGVGRLNDLAAKFDDELASLRGEASELRRRVSDLGERVEHPPAQSPDPLAALGEQVRQVSAAIAPTGEVQQRLHELEARADSFNAALAAVGELDKRLTEIGVRMDALAAACAAIPGFDQRLGALSGRIDVIERLLGMQPAKTPGEEPSALEQLLEVRLGQLEGRIAAMLEGPYFQRLVDELRPSTQPASA